MRLGKHELNILKVIRDFGEFSGNNIYVLIRAYAGLRDKWSREELTEDAKKIVHKAWAEGRKNVGMKETIQHMMNINLGTNRSIFSRAMKALIAKKLVKRYWEVGWEARGDYDCYTERGGMIAYVRGKEEDGDVPWVAVWKHCYYNLTERGWEELEKRKNRFSKDECERDR